VTPHLVSQLALTVTKTMSAPQTADSMSRGSPLLPSPQWPGSPRPQPPGDVVPHLNPVRLVHGCTRQRLLVRVRNPELHPLHAGLEVGAREHGLSAASDSKRQSPYLVWLLK